MDNLPLVTDGEPRSSTNVDCSLSLVLINEDSSQFVPLASSLFVPDDRLPPPPVDPVTKADMDVVLNWLRLFGRRLADPRLAGLGKKTKTGKRAQGRVVLEEPGVPYTVIWKGEYQDRNGR